jgi:hypothetical protein
VTSITAVQPLRSKTHPSYACLQQITRYADDGGSCVELAALETERNGGQDLLKQAAWHNNRKPGTTHDNCHITGDCRTSTPAYSCRQAPSNAS